MTTKHQDLQARLLATFQVEAQEHLQTITAHLLTLDQGLPHAKAPEIVEATFREVHTLKGAARSVGLKDVEALCQALESVLSRITHGQVTFTPTILKAIQEGMDGVAHLLASGETRPLMNALITRLEEVPGEADAGRESGFRSQDSPPVPRPVLPLPAADTIRLHTTKLDAVLLRVEDFLVPKLAANERVREVTAVVGALTACRELLKRFPAVHPAAGPPTSPSDGAETELRAGLESRLIAAEAQTQALMSSLVHDHRTISGTVDGLLEKCGGCA
jgi:two-component system chemotaxis sensor kinase CheA